MRGSATAIIVSLFGFIAILGMLAYIFLIKPQNTDSTGTNFSANSSTGVSAIPVKDFAPNIPMSQKTTILIMSNDSSEEKYIVPTSQVDTYVKQLPAGYHVVSKTP